MCMQVVQVEVEAVLGSEAVSVPVTVQILRQRGEQQQPDHLAEVEISLSSHLSASASGRYSSTYRYHEYAYS